MFLLFSLHHPHREHTPIVCPKPPPPPMCIVLHRLPPPNHISIVFPSPPLPITTTHFSCFSYTTTQLYCLASTAAATTTITTFLLFPFTATTTAIKFLLVFLLHLHIIYPTLTLYWPYIAPHINPTSI